MPAAGTTKAYRPKPDGFREVYIRLGFGDELKEHYHTNLRCLRRWVDEEGYDGLHLARREYLRKTRWPNGAPGHRKRPHCFVRAKERSNRDQPGRQPTARSDPAHRAAPTLGGHLRDFAKPPAARGWSHTKIRSVATAKAKRLLRMRLARDMADAGEMVGTIAEKMGMSVNTVRKYLIEATARAANSA